MLQPERTVAAETAHAAVAVLGHGRGIHGSSGRCVPIPVRWKSVGGHRRCDARRWRWRHGWRHAVHVETLVVVVGHCSCRQRGVESPSAETFCKRRCWRDLGRDPVVVGGVAWVEGVVERLHESVKLRTESCGLAEVRGGVDEVTFPFPPFGAAVFEPNLKMIFFYKLTFLTPRFWLLLQPVCSVTRFGVFWTLGNFLKPLATITLPRSCTFLGNFCKGAKIYHFSSEIIFGQPL